MKELKYGAISALVGATVFFLFWWIIGLGFITTVIALGLTAGSGAVTNLFLNSTEDNTKQLNW